MADGCNQWDLYVGKNTYPCRNEAVSVTHVLLRPKYSSLIIHDLNLQRAYAAYYIHIYSPRGVRGFKMLFFYGGLFDVSDCLVRVTRRARVLQAGTSIIINPIMWWYLSAQNLPCRYHVSQWEINFGRRKLQDPSLLS